jgi:hypothetical protein
MENKDVMYLSMIVASFFISKLIPFGDFTLFMAVCAIFSKRFGVLKMCAIWSIPQLSLFAELPALSDWLKNELSQVTVMAFTTSNYVFNGFKNDIFARAFALSKYSHPMLNPTVTDVYFFSSQMSVSLVVVCSIGIFVYGWVNIYWLKSTFEKKGLFRRISF